MLDNENVLHRKLILEQIVANVGRNFIMTSNINEGINEALEKIGRFSQASRAYIFQFSDDGMMMDNTYEWCEEGVTPEIDHLKGLPTNMFPWWMEQLASGRILNIHEVEALSEEARAEKDILEMQGIKSVLVLPIIMESKLSGFVGFDNVNGAGVWNNEDESILSIAAEMFSNVFERIKKEEELRKSNEDLKTALEEVKSVHLQLIQHEQMAAIGQLAGGVAHEINNPLGYAISNQDTLMKYVNEMVSIIEKQDKAIISEKDSESLEFIKEDISELLEDINNGLERVAKIVDVLRSITHKDSEIEVEEYNISKGIQDTVLLLNNRIKKLGEVVVNVEKDIPSVRVNINSINWVIVNLVNNALDAIEEKGESSDGKLWINTKVTNTELHLSIKDNGIGMSESVQMNIFNPFFTTKKIGKGSGLGLSMVYDIIINKHDGSIEVKSQENVGSEFIICIPIRVLSETPSRI